MSASLNLRTEGGPAVRKMLDSFSGRELSKRSRRAVRAAGKVFRTSLRSEAAGRSDLPRSFRKTKTRAHTLPEIAVSIRPKSPLFNIYEPGASAHVIAPRRASALGGPAGTGSWTEKGRKRKGAFFSRRAVSHPGMAARPLLAPAFSGHESQAMRAGSAALFAGTGVEIGLGDD